MALGSGDRGHRRACESGAAAVVYHRVDSWRQWGLASADRLAGVGTLRRPAITRPRNLLARPADRDCPRATWAGIATLERHWPSRTLSDLWRHLGAGSDHDRTA